MNTFNPYRTIVLALFIFIWIIDPINAQYKLFPELPAWKLSEKNLIFQKSDLFDYIDGAADSYLSYEFEEVSVREYTKGKQAIKAEIYRHSDNNNGFGIYAAERFPDYHFINIGSQAYTSEDILNMTCGRYYVKLFSETRTPEEKETLISLAELIANHLVGKSSLPSTLQMFPDKGKIINSEQYINQSFLGYDFLAKAFTADYSRDNTGFKLFIIDCGGKNKAQEMLTDYLKFTKQEMEKLNEGEIVVTDKFNGNIPCFWTGQFLLGCLNLDNHELIEYYLSELKKNVTE
jgi:hypothetical protein